MTDTLNLSGPGFDSAIDATANTVALSYLGEINGLHLNLSGVRLVKTSRTVNRSPTLEVPHVLIAPLGRTTRTMVRASDPDGDPLVFHVQIGPPFAMRLRDVAASVVTDHGDGSLDLEFTPQETDVGLYPLRIAAFDDEGGVAVEDVKLVISGTCVGDCNTDSHVTIDELVTGVAIAIGDLPASRCLSLDADGSGRVRFDEVVRAVQSALNGCSP